MESRNKLAMCRLCLCENECFVNIFEHNDWQGYVAAEVICDLLQFQVSETDGYPHVVCLACLSKLNDFKLFKECCQKSIVTYDDMFVPSRSLEEHKSEMVEHVTINAEPIYYSDDEDNDSKVELPLAETVKHPKYSHFLDDKRPHFTSKGEIEGDSCTWSISTNDESAFDKSKNISLSEEVEASYSGTMERMVGQRILPGESMYMTPPLQKDISIGKEIEKERGRRDEDIGGDVEGLSGTGPEEVRKELECIHCGIVSMNKLDLKRHMKVHEFVNSYECDACGEAFCFNSECKKHILTQTVSKAYKCTECSKSFGKNYALKRHMRSHTDSKPYKCSECSKSYSHSYHLKTHMRLHIDPKPYKCEECGKSFSQNADLKKHMVTHTGSTLYKCAECGKSFGGNSALKRHMISHSASKPYKCEYCSKSFSQNYQLKTHMNSHTGSKPYKCAYCSKCFSDNSNFKKHIKIHTGSKPYKCAACSKCFSENYLLKIHLKSHSGSKPC